MSTANNSSNSNFKVYPVVLSGGNSVITTGFKGFFEVTQKCRVVQVTLVAEQTTGSIVLDLWKGTYASIPTVANTITASAKPTLSSEQKSQDTTLTGWTIDWEIGDIIGVNVDSCTGIQNVSLLIKTNLL